MWGKVVFLLVNTAFLTVAILFLFRPHQIIRLHARFYRTVYKDVLHQEDAQVDRFPMLPADRSLMGSRSRYVREATDHPERYPGMITLIRVIGIVIFLCALCFYGVAALFIMLGAG